MDKRLSAINRHHSRDTLDQLSIFALLNFKEGRYDVATSAYDLLMVDVHYFILIRTILI